MRSIIHVDRFAQHGRADFEVVERKGLGHPDTLCDDLSEVACQALCRHYRDRFGALLPVKMDQFLLVGAGSRPAFGGGELLGPVRLVVRGTAATVVDGERLPVEDVLAPPLRALLADRLRLPDPIRDVRIEWMLREVHFDRSRFGDGGRPRAAEDTSLAAGYAPRTQLESLVLDVEAHLQSAVVRAACPALGREIKIMAVREGDRVSLTIAAAMIDTLVPDRRAYEEARAFVVEAARARCLEAELRPDVAVNTFDDIPLALRALSHTGTYRDVHPEAYILVTGSHAEKGTGLTGRGNRINGLITPMQPMSIEAPWGKPPWHPGRLYEVAAFDMAEQVRARTGARHANVHLVSRIGSAIGSPDRVLATVEGDVDEAEVRRVLEERVAGLPDLADSLSVLPSLPVPPPTLPWPETNGRPAA